MFEQACKLKLRFSTIRGEITAEDVWDLPLNSRGGPSLVILAKELNKEIKENSADDLDFLEIKTPINKDLETKFSIVKRVIEVRLKEIEKRKNAKTAKEKREQILRLIADKENDELAGKSIEELRTMID